MQRKLSCLSVTGTMCLQPAKTKVEGTKRISMGLSILTQLDFDI
jgi:hypothetical protein